MPTETLHPATQAEWLSLRAKEITSTEVGALFGISPYVTLFELWHRKRDQKVVEIEQNEFMKWGTRLQDSIAAGVAEDNGWQIRRMSEYMRIPDLRLGASFDFGIIIGGVELGILEIKNVFNMVFKEEWLEDEEGNYEAPAHIEIQVQHQLLVSGREIAYIAALVGGNKLVLIKRKPDPLVQAAIRERAAAFWATIESGDAPAIDFARDSEFLTSIYGYAEPGKIFDARSDLDFHALCEQHRKLGEAEKAAKAGREMIKAKLLTMIGDAEKVIANGFTISAGMVGPAKIAYDREAYRLFKINWPRGKKV